MPMPSLRVLALVPLLAGLLSAPAARADVKIGYFDAKRVLAEADEAKAAKARLEDELKRKQKQIDDQRVELERAKKDLDQRAPVMSQSAKDQAEGELMQKLQAAQKLYIELQQDLAAREQQVLGELLTRLEPVVREIADAEGYQYVFEKSGLFVAPSAHDLTAQVIRKYNQRFPAGKGSSGGKSEGKAKGGDKK